VGYGEGEKGIRIILLPLPAFQTEDVVNSGYRQAQAAAAHSNHYGW
jgi:hypothetical protein